MSRTFRRKNQQHEYQWVLINWTLYQRGVPCSFYHPKSRFGKKAIAIFHSDKSVTMGDAAPRWYRKKYDHMRRTRNNRVMKLWLDGREIDPLFEVWHRHEANGTWW
jgi:hypothetical protein